MYGSLLAFWVDAQYGYTSFLPNKYEFITLVLTIHWVQNSKQKISLWKDLVSYWLTLKFGSALVFSDEFQIIFRSRMEAPGIHLDKSTTMEV